MVSHTYKCVFVHIRKNAGGSIIQSFPAADREASDVGYGTDGTYDRYWDTGRYPGYLTFAVARNPWSRFISGWQWLCRRPFEAKGNLGPEFYRCTSLKEILRDLPERLPETSHDRRHLFWRQVDMLTDAAGRFVADEVLRFETLDRDYARLCKRIGKPYSPLPHRNEGSTKGCYWDYYDAETRDLVHRMFRSDIEFFGYKFGDPDHL